MLHKRPWCAVAAVLAALPVAFAPIPKPRANPAKEELRRLQGRWELVSCSLGGKPMPVTPGAEADVIRGDRLTTVKGGEVVASWRVTLDPAKAPRRMDLKGEGGKLQLAIYRLDGDTLTVSYKGERGATGRPADFRPGAGVWVVVLERKRP